MESIILKDWTLEETLPLIQQLNIALSKHNICVGLWGSILYTGSSKKDLDIILIPLKTYYNIDEYKVEQALKYFGIYIHCKRIHKYDDKSIYECKYKDGRRIDILTILFDFNFGI